MEDGRYQTADSSKFFCRLQTAVCRLSASVDGKAAKKIKDANGHPILMLNVFAHTLKVHLASWSVKGDKTNEPGCLKQHLEELFELFPCLKLLTGDAIYADRSLLKAIQKHHRDYLIQVKAPNIFIGNRKSMRSCRKPTSKFNIRNRTMSCHVKKGP